ncbi:hypothetical protein VQ02_10490, partial [Methylobacterium variabile]
GLTSPPLRPRREIMQDYRDVVAATYSPEAYFDRVRRLGRLLDRPTLRPRRIHWQTVRRDGAAFLRLVWSLHVRHPELAGQFWRTLYDCLRHRPKSLQAVLRNVAHFVHLYPFGRYVVRTIDARIAEFDAGQWAEPETLPAARETCAPPPVAAVA